MTSLILETRILLCYNWLEELIIMNATVQRVEDNFIVSLPNCLKVMKMNMSRFKLIGVHL